MADATLPQPAPFKGVLRVESAGPEDAALVHRLTRAAFAEQTGVVEPVSGALLETEAEVAAAIATGGAALAWLDDIAVGAVRYQVQPDHLYVGRLATLPEHRNHGIAGALMSFAEDHARTLGLPETRVIARARLAANVAFFERRGYRQTSVQPHERQPAELEVHLAKSLTAEPRLDPGA